MQHAWPEVYFPGVGWVEFEPTSSQAPLVRPSGEKSPSAGQAGSETPALPAGQNITGQPTPIQPGETSNGLRVRDGCELAFGADFDLRHHRYHSADKFLRHVR